MASGQQKVFAGAFVVLAVALLVGTVAVINQWNRAETRSFEVHFSPGMSVAGLNAGSRVRFKGVPIGRVSEISLVPDPKGVYAVAYLDIVEDHVRFLNARTRAVLKLEGITGAVSIDLTVPDAAAEADPRDAEWLAQDRPVIQAEASDLARILEQTPRVIDAFGAFALRLNDFYDRNEGRIDGMLARLDAMAVHGVPRFLDLVDHADRVLQTAERRVLASGGTLDRVESSLEGGVATLADGVTAAADRMTSEIGRSIDETGAPLQDFLVESRLAIAEFRDLVADTRTLVGINRRELEGLIAGMRDAFESLDKVLVELETHPAALVRGAPKQDE
jgi:phospholipid/cholesterol/gamma-HCH transport system substrate-binding protein